MKRICALLNDLVMWTGWIAILVGIAGGIAYLTQLVLTL